MESRPVIFLSHTDEDAPIALALQAVLAGSLLGHQQFFNSSDRVSVRPGDPWHDRILQALAQSAVVIVIATPRSVLSPWVNFESGGGYLAGAKVLPCCLSGMRPEDLPAPLRHLQAADLSTPAGFQDLLRVVAHALEGALQEDLDLHSMVEGAAAAVNEPVRRFANWVFRSALRPRAMAGTRGSGAALVAKRVSAVRPLAVRTFHRDLSEGDSVCCWVTVPDSGVMTLYNCFASGKVAERVVELAARNKGDDIPASVRLRCLGVIKEFATEVSWGGDEDQGTSFAPAYMIEEVELGPVLQ